MNILKRNYLGKQFPSDLRKLPCCAAKAFLLSKIFSVSGEYLESFSTIHVLNNKMRRLPNIIEHVFGKDALELYRKLGRTVLKISNYKNHRRFSLRCLSKVVIPVSLKLKNNIITYKSECIIYQAEKKLLNERIKNINNTIEHLDHEKYKYIGMCLWPPFHPS